MARRTVAAQNIEDLSTVAEEGLLSHPLGHVPLNMRYVSCELDDTSPFSGLLWMEVRQIQRRAKMTLLQAVVWEWTLAGLSTHQIAQAMDRSEPTVLQHLHAAEAKAKALGPLGLLTYLFETCGPEVVREILAERLDVVVPKHRLARKMTRSAYEAGQAAEIARLKGN